MTNGNIPLAGKGNRGLISALITANLLVMVVGIITLTPNLLGLAEKIETPVAQNSALPAVTEQSPAAEVKDENTTDVNGISQAPEAPEAPAIALSNDERPDLEDFLWYTEDVQYNGVPAGVETIDNQSLLSGRWKALIIYDPNTEFDSNAMEFLNISLVGTEDDVSLTLDWYQIFWANDGESLDESDMEDTVFSGKWENGGLWASGAGTIRLTQFYSLSNKQYAIGTVDTPDGIPALVALVRP